MSKNVGVILAGCGVQDGSEIHEAVLTLLSLDRRKATVHCFAPDIAQADVMNHLTGKPAAEQRNVLVESARIARGAVQDLKVLEISALDAVVLPGGFGAAKNLCNYATAGVDARAQADVQRVLREAFAARKPIGAMCIAPEAVAAALRGELCATLTIGSSAADAAAIERMGHKHQSCAVRDIVVDREHRIVTTPAYMLARNISEAAEGIDRLVEAVLELA